MKGTKTLLSYLIFLIGLQWKTVYVSAEECGLNYFKCKKNGRCIIGAFRCDGEYDCDDGDGDDRSDEEECKITAKPVTACSSDSDFQCKNGKCIPKSYTCDFLDDCGDNSDESSTDGPLCANTDKCPSGMFQCKKSGKCTYQSYVCDGESDCGENDSSDEENCDSSCAADEFKCFDSRCIDKDWVCDGTDDCGNNLDENDCTTTPISTTPRTTLATTLSKSLNVTAGLLRMGLNCNLFSFFCPQDKRCVHDNWVCDGSKDCEDGHDESPEICDIKCKKDEFTCSDGSCISQKQKCDGIKQCPNGEDEVLPQCDVSVPCTNSTFKCQGSPKCIKEENVCDRIKHCPKGDDEGDKCGVNECSKDNGGCSHHCVDLKLGHLCSCPLGFELLKDNKTCKDINECLQPGLCSQFCTNKDSSYSCQCDEGYELMSDKSTCKAKGPTPFLMFSNKKEIREVSTNFHEYRSVIKGTDHVASIDADIGHEMIYWANTKDKTINRAHIDGHQASEVIVKNVVPSSLSVDWISRKLFWINKDMNCISVANLDGSHSKTFLKGTTEDRFEDLHVMPDKGTLLISNLGKEAKIEQISLDGSERNSIIESYVAAAVSLLSVDRIIDRLYWFNEKLSHVMSSKMDGTDIKTIIKLNGTVMNGLTIFEDYLYLSSEKANQIYKYNKFTGKRHGNIKKVESPMDIMVYHPVVQKKVLHPCQLANGGCSHLCFVSSSYDKEFKCDCPDTMKLHKDKKTCIPKEIVPLLNCENGYLCRASKQCIPNELVCNGVRNCALNDDEMNCSTSGSTSGSTSEENKNTKSNSNLYIIIGGSISVLVLLIILVIVFLQYRKKSKRQEMSMVFEKENEMILGKDFSNKEDVEIKYVPNTLKKKDKKIENINYNENSLPLQMEGDCMVDSSESVDICSDESDPIIS